jgi:2-polyprenyl-6-methoxyphenol hydroxylase-like FAD-dependent oxidoreductase
LINYGRTQAIRILVAGAGLGGLTFVRALQGFDAFIDIVERSTTFATVGVGIVLHPNGMGVLAHLGLSEIVHAKGNVIRRMEIIRGDHRLDLLLSEVWSGTSHPTISILRPDLHEILAQASLRENNVRLRMGRRVTAVNISEREPEAMFDDGTRERYDLIVASDGVHSAIRRSLLSGSEAVSTNFLYFRFPAHNTIGLPPDTWRTVERPGASYGFIPLSNNRVHCFVQLQTDERLDYRGTEEEFFEREFCPWDVALQQALKARCAPLHAGFAYMVSPFSWGAGACVLIGDAAHAISPTLSEGGSLAMEDAVVLSLALRRASSIPEAMDIYRSVRQKRVMWSHRMALAQVNSLQRQRTQIQTDSGIATRHLQQMYEPLRANPIPDFLFAPGM